MDAKSARITGSGAMIAPLLMGLLDSAIVALVIAAVIIAVGDAWARLRGRSGSGSWDVGWKRKLKRGAEE